MKLKSLLILAALSATTSLFAAVTSSEVLCRIAVNSGTKSTIVALPLKDVASEADAITLANLVYTGNLSEGDTLFASFGSSNGKDNLCAWMIVEENGVNVWSPIASVEGMSVQQPDEATKTALARGGAIWVNRENVNTPIYIYGQVSEAVATAPTIAAGSAATPAYTMIGNPLLKDVNLNGSDLTWVAVNGDQIVWGMAGGLGYQTYQFKNNAWGAYKIVDDEPVWSTDVVLPAGQGFWYVTKSAGTRSLTWNVAQ